MGDGYHSLATAKACYEEQKKGKTPEEYLALPARYALVEVVNNHDDALQFEPIHRVLFGVDHQKFMDAFRAAYPNAYEGKGRRPHHRVRGTARATLSLCLTPRCSWRWVRYRALSTST